MKNVRKFPSIFLSYKNNIFSILAISKLFETFYLEVQLHDFDKSCVCTFFYKNYKKQNRKITV